MTAEVAVTVRFTTAHVRYTPNADYTLTHYSVQSRMHGEYHIMILYHVTLRKTKNRILKEGIRPQKKSSYKGAFGQELKETGKVYAFDRYHDAVKYASSMHYDFEQHVIIVAFKRDIQQFEIDTHWQSMGAKGYWLKMSGSIPPENIVEVIELTPDMRRAIVQAINENAELTRYGMVDMGSKDRFFLKELYDVQDTTIEHQEPNASGEVSYFIEPAGDIYRELSLKTPDYSYITEKLNRLHKFEHLTAGDRNEVKEARRNHLSYAVELEKYLQKADALAKKTAAFDFKEYEERKPKMLKSLAVIDAIAHWGQGVYHESKVEKEIDELSRMFDLFKK